ncbi:cache domain-containing protein, partial [Campylobacter sp. 2018MI01]|uniref:cache domain-containing protein n=1 Tax=Campylobacter sp. 2018MI01 TaxID=2836735 RepID=UPI001BDA8A77
MKLSTKIALFSFIGILINSIVLVSLHKYYDNYSVNYTKHTVEDEILTAKKQQVKALVESVLRYSGAIYEKHKNDGTLNNFKAELQEYLSKVRFGRANSYYTVFDKDGNIYYHPSSSWINTNKYNENDAKGMKFVQEMIKSADNNDGYVRYFYEDANTNKVMEKLSYTSKDKASGLYFMTWLSWETISKTSIEKVSKDTEEQSYNNMITFIITTALIIVAIVSLSIIFVKFQITRPLNNLTAKSNELSSGDGDLTKKLDDKGNDEIAQACKAINIFLEKV